MVEEPPSSDLLQPQYEIRGDPKLLFSSLPPTSVPTVRPSNQPALRRRCQGIFNNRLGNEKPNQKLVRGTPLSLGRERGRGGCGEEQGTDAKKSVEAAEEFPGNCFYGPAPHQCQASASTLHLSGRFRQKQHHGLAANSPQRNFLRVGFAPFQGSKNSVMIPLEL